MNLKPRISKSLNQVGITQFLLIGLWQGVALKPASTGPVRRKDDEQPQTPKQLFIMETGTDQILPHLKRGSQESKDLKNLLAQLGYISFKAKGKSHAKPKTKTKRKNT